MPAAAAAAAAAVLPLSGHTAPHPGLSGSAAQQPQPAAGCHCAGRWLRHLHPVTVCCQGGRGSSGGAGRQRAHRRLCAQGGWAPAGVASSWCFGLLEGGKQAGWCGHLSRLCVLGRRKTAEGAGSGALLNVIPRTAGAVGSNKAAAAAAAVTSAAVQIVAANGLDAASGGPVSIISGKVEEVQDIGHKQVSKGGGRGGMCVDKGASVTPSWCLVRSHGVGCDEYGGGCQLASLAWELRRLYPKAAAANIALSAPFPPPSHSGVSDCE